MLTSRVILTQLLWVAVVFASAKFGKKPLVFTTIILLCLTMMHLFSLPLFILQTTVILATAAVCYHRIREEEVREIMTAFRDVFDHLSSK